MRPDLHEVLVVAEEPRAPHGALGEVSSLPGLALEVALVEGDLDLGQAHPDDVLKLGQQELGQRRVVPSLQRSSSECTLNICLFQD